MENLILSFLQIKRANNVRKVLLLVGCSNSTDNLEKQLIESGVDLNIYPLEWNNKKFEYECCECFPIVHNKKHVGDSIYLPDFDSFKITDLTTNQVSTIEIPYQIPLNTDHEYIVAYLIEKKYLTMESRDFYSYDMYQDYLVNKKFIEENGFKVNDDKEAFNVLKDDLRYEKKKAGYEVIVFVYKNDILDYKVRADYNITCKKVHISDYTWYRNGKEILIKTIRSYPDYKLSKMEIFE